jgi:NTE family protein
MLEGGSSGGGYPAEGMGSQTRRQMKNPLRDWLQRRGLPFAKRSSREGRPSGSVEHLRMGQSLVRDDVAQDSVSLILQGCCESGHLRDAASLQAGDAIDGEGGDRLNMRAIVDSDVFRFPRRNILRLLDRWPAMLKPGAPSSLQTARPPAGKKGYGKILCLIPLSEGVPCEEFSSVCAETIARETAEAVLCIKVDNGAPVSNGGATPSPGAGLQAVFIQHADGGNSTQALRVLARQLDRARERFSYVIVEAHPQTRVEALMEIIRRSWSIYPVLRQTGESLFELNLLAREARARGCETIPIKPLIFLDPVENAHGLSCYIEETVKWPVHRYLRKVENGGGFTANLRRLGREMCGCQVGLALSSGAARGLSHIGVIQVLEENGIEVDIVAGSSMGAYIGAVWGAGYGGREMEKFAREIEGYRGLWRLMDFAILPHRGFLLTDRVRKRLEETIGPLHFSDMARPIRVVATRLDTLERAVFSGGNVVDAVLASLAIPGICVPVTRDGISYVDGGICDPLPVDALIDIGVRKIIAVNTIATPQTMRVCISEGADAGEADSIWSRRLNRWFNPFASGNAFDTLMRSIHAAQTRLAEVSCRRASVVLRPYSCGGGWHDFRTPARYISLGREEASSHLPAIRELVNTPIHERQPPRNALAQAA